MSLPKGTRSPAVSKLGLGAEQNSRSQARRRAPLACASGKLARIPRTAGPKRREKSYWHLERLQLCSRVRIRSREHHSQTWLHVGIAWGALKNCWCPQFHTPPPPDSNVSGLGWGLGIWIFKSFPGHCN